MWLLYIVGMCVLLGDHSVVKAGYEFFRYHEATFQCEHGVAAADLAEVEWKINGIRCAHLQIGAGNTVIIKYYCGLENRANMTSSNLTIYSLEPYDDGEFSCKAVDTFFKDFIGATFNVTVKVSPKNHRLLYNNTSYTCSDGTIIVDNALSDLTLTCSVESKPKAIFTWLTNPQLSEPLLNKTECDRTADLVYNCTNILTLPSDKVPQVGIEVTCHVEAVGNTTELCIKLGPVTTTSVIATTASPPTTETTASSTAKSDSSTKGGTRHSSLTTATQTAITTTKSDTGTTDDTRSSTLSLITVSKEQSILKLRAIFKDMSFVDDFGKPETKTFRVFATNFCNAVNNSLTSLAYCKVIKIRKSSVLVDAILKFNQDALEEELKHQLKTDNIANAISKTLRSKAPLFQDATISVTSDDTTKSSTTTPVKPTSSPSSKWKNIYILPIVVGIAVIIIIIVVLTICRCKKSDTPSGERHTRNFVSHRPPNVIQPPLYATYETIPENTPARPHVKPHQPYTKSGRQQHQNVHQWPGNNTHGTVRRSAPAVRNDNSRHPGQGRKTSHGATRRSEPAKYSNKQSHPQAYRQFQPSSATNAHYPIFQGHAPYGGYPGNRRFPAPHSQMTGARAYNNYTVPPNY